MVHGTHYQATSRDAFGVGKTWGPWLWYLNDGSQSDAAARWTAEQAAWPYAWFKDAAYQARGTLTGSLLLSDGPPASGAAIFLGDNRNTTVSTLDQGQKYYYTTYADEKGAFSIPHVRTGSYALSAWSNAGSLSPLTTTFTHNDIAIEAATTTSLPHLTWPVSVSSTTATRIFQIGAFDPKTDGFRFADPTSPIQHARLDKCPANLTYTVSVNEASDWCFAQSQLGTWSVIFASPTRAAATLVLSLAGFSQGSSATVLLNGVRVGDISSAALPNSQDTYRGATRAGEWHRLEFPVGAGVLVQGSANTLDIRVTKSERWRGWLWDSLVLETA